MLAFAYETFGTGHKIVHAMNFDGEEKLEEYRPILANIWPSYTWAPQYTFPENCWVNWVRDTPEGEWYNPNPAPESHTPDLS